MPWSLSGLRPPVAGVGEEGDQQHRPPQAQLDRPSPQVLGPGDEERRVVGHVGRPALAEYGEGLPQTGGDAAVSVAVGAGPDRAGQELQSPVGSPAGHVGREGAVVGGYTPDGMEQTRVEASSHDKLVESREYELPPVAA